MPQLLQAGPCHLRLAAQRIRILDPVAMGVRKPDFTVLEHRPECGRHQEVLRGK